MIAPCLLVLATNVFILLFTTSLAITIPFSFRCSAICVVLEPGLAHMSSTRSPGCASRAIAGIIETASCLVKRPVSWSADSITFTSPSAFPLSKGRVQALPTPVNQFIFFASISSSQFSTHSLSSLRGLTLTVSDNLSMEWLNHLSESSLQLLTALRRTLSEAMVSQDRSSKLISQRSTY